MCGDEFGDVAQLETRLVINEFSAGRDQMRMDDTLHEGRVALHLFQIEELRPLQHFRARGPLQPLGCKICGHSGIELWDAQPVVHEGCRTVLLVGRAGRAAVAGRQEDNHVLGTSASFLEAAP